MTPSTSTAEVLDAARSSEARIIPFEGGAQAKQDAPTKTVRSGYSYTSEPSAVPDASGLHDVIDADTLTGIEGRPAYCVAKRAFDVALSGAALVGFSWLYGAVALAVKIDDPAGPVLFRQTRVGWSIIGQKSGAASEYAIRPALSALGALSASHPRARLGVVA